MQYITKNNRCFTDDQKMNKNIVLIFHLHQDVDLSLHGMTPTPDRVKIIDMTSSVIYEDLKIMVKWPEEMDRWKEVARPFDALVFVYQYINMTRI